MPVDTGLKLNVHKTFRRRPGRPGRLLNVLCMFNLRPVATEISSTMIKGRTLFRIKSQMKK